MVTLTRFCGSRFALNPDLVERVEETPDTVITLVDGTKYLVKESLAEVVAAVTEYRARLLAAVGTIDVQRPVTRRGPLSAVPPCGDSTPDQDG